MKIAALVATGLLGLAFTLFGLMGLGVIPQPQSPLPTGDALAFLMALMNSHYMMAVAAVEVIGGVLLLISLLRRGLAPVGLLFSGPVVVNIDFYHLFLDPNRDPKAIGPAVLVSVLSLFLLIYHRRAFAALTREN